MFFKNKKENRFTPVRLKSLNDTLIGCRLNNKGQLNILYDQSTTKFTQNQIENAVKKEILPVIGKIIEKIENNNI